MQALGMADRMLVSRTKRLAALEAKANANDEGIPLERGRNSSPVCFLALLTDHPTLIFIN